MLYSFDIELATFFYI